MKALSRILQLSAILIGACSAASGYYNWVFFPASAGPYNNRVVARIDLSQVPSNTVPFFISDQPPNPMVPGDTFPALISQIRAAAAVWSQVPTSNLRLTFGGMETIGQTPQTAPGIDVVFDDDIPPGLYALTRVSLPQDLSFLNRGGTFVPISRSTVHLRKDLTVYQQASYYDSFFLTIVHEFGHALGLQHSLTSGVMSTDLTRATTKAAPLAADDIAGVSMLYPAPGYVASTGSIVGTVQIGGTGVNMASVVALSTNGVTANGVAPNYGVAISTLTNPDGTFSMGGVPPGQYYVYTHPLPPAATGESYPDNIVPPQDLSQNAFPANTGMDTQFYGDTRDWTQAGIVTVKANAATTGIDFLNMQPRSAPSVYAVETYAYLPPGPSAKPVPTPPLISGSRLYLVFTGPGTTQGDAIAPGLSINPIGSFARTEAGSAAYWEDGFDLVILDASPIPTAPTPVALAITVPNAQFGNDLYVLPSAFTVVSTPPPLISSVTAAGGADALGNPLVNVAGTNLNAATRVVFDGAPAAVLSANQDGSLTVVAPPAPGTYVASVEALGGDGQTSMQWLGVTPTPLDFTYAAPNPSFFVNVAVLQAGVDSEVDIIATNKDFVQGQVSVGFGDSDIQLRRLWVFAPGRLLLDVSVPADAQPGPVTVTVSNGLEVETLSGVLQVSPSKSAKVSLRYPVLNQATLLDGIQAGGGMLINTAGLPASLAGWKLYVDSQPTNFSVNGSQIVAAVPLVPTGAAIVQLVPPDGGLVAPLIMQVDAPPPQILGLTDANGVAIGASNPMHQGDVVTAVVSNLADPASSAAPTAGQVQITVAEVGGQATVTDPASTLTAGTQAGTTLVQFTLDPNAPYGSQQTLTVGLGTRISPALTNLVILPK